MTLHGLGSAEAASDDGATGTTFKRATVNDTIVTTPVLDGDRAFKVDPVNGESTVMTYGWNVSVDSQGNQRLMLASAIIRIEDFWDEQVALMELGTGIFTGVPTRQISIDSNAKLFISDKDGDDFGQTITGYLAVDIDYFFLWLYDQRSLTDTLDVLWIRKPGAGASGPGYAFHDNDPSPDTITDSGNGFGIFTAGMLIGVTGTDSNDGTYRIASVTAGVITLVSSNTLTNEPDGFASIIHSAQWYKAIDVTGHGDGVDDVIALTMGTHTGKGPLPTTGGPFYFVNAVLQNLLVAPNGGSAEPKDDAKGSFACKVKMPSANGTFGDFDAGTGTNPDWNDVKEIPSDDATSYDEGNIGSAEVTTSNIGFKDVNPDTITLPIGGAGFVPGATITVSGSINNDGTYTIDSISGADPDPVVLILVPGDTLINEQTGIDITITQVGDLQSYAIADVGGGEEVLAVQVVGAASQTGVSVDLTPRPFIYDGTTRHNLPTFGVGATWFRLNDADEDVTLNQINGVDLSESLFNLLEAGLEIVQVQNGAVLRGSQMAIEYAIPGVKVLPDTFPLLAPPVTEDRRRALIQQEI